MTYHLLQPFSIIVRDEDGATIPADLDNRDYQQYQQWIAEGHVPAERTLDLAHPPEASEA
jgi:hypothetical protein